MAKLGAPEGLVKHDLYTNEVLEDMFEELLETKLNVMNLMTVDRSLAEHAGMIKKVNVYKYAGTAEVVGRGEGNADSGVITRGEKQHEVETVQHLFQYADEDLMTDPKAVENGLIGAAKTMINHFNNQYFEALLEEETVEDQKVRLVKEVEHLNEKGEATSYKQLCYEAVVDAIAALELEPIPGALGEGNADDAFILLSPAHMAQIRKDKNFMAAQDGAMLRSGIVGTIAGLPVIQSRLVPAGEVYVGTKEAVTCFIKKESQVEQDRDINRRMNTVVMRKVNVVALTDATKMVRIVLK